MKKTRMLLVASMLFSSHALADEEYGPPLSRCLNKHTVPYIKSERRAEEIVSAAYEACDLEVKQWTEDRRPLPAEMISQQDKELRDFYIRMIEIRRKSGGR